MKQQQQPTLLRNRSCSGSGSTRQMIPSNHLRSTPPMMPEQEDSISSKLLSRRDSPVSLQRINKVHSVFSTLFRSLFKMIAGPIPTCKWLPLPPQLSIIPSQARKVTGTLFGHRRGHVSFAVQEDPRCEPVLLLELAISTSMLVREMSSGLVRLALECEKAQVSSAHAGGRRSVKLLNEPMWTMYCNGRKCRYAVSRACTDYDWHVLSTLQTISVGAGVIPVAEDAPKSGRSEGELLYMRAKFERVVGSRDSEAFYMMNPDGNGGPELSVFLLRI